ncbi:hypothetical protein BDV95DRAFT_605900 [Massariosphaeria phaeospora]|uniref:Uncharacterized protein n=1 Tax=Massariosphaeria phaeospora TaxID=100035 RepID=A0A7C8IAK0_9PLEO|nr:hypothetical protein BDV95DRAFT_605900 [Massariosphaeria phaeospora]
MPTSRGFLRAVMVLLRAVIFVAYSMAIKYHWHTIVANMPGFGILELEKVTAFYVSMLTPAIEGFDLDAFHVYQPALVFRNFAHTGYANKTLKLVSYIGNRSIKTMQWLFNDWSILWIVLWVVLGAMLVVPESFRPTTDSRELDKTASTEQDGAGSQVAPDPTKEEAIVIRARTNMWKVLKRNGHQLKMTPLTEGSPVSPALNRAQILEQKLLRLLVLHPDLANQIYCEAYCPLRVLEDDGVLAQLMKIETLMEVEKHKNMLDAKKRADMMDWEAAFEAGYE